MFQFITTFISNVPIFIPFLFVFFLWLGIRSSKERDMPKIVYYLFPLLSLISIYRVSTFSHPELAWTVFFLGTTLGAIIGYQLQGRWLILDLGNQVRVSGEWFTMITIMTIFFAQFVNGAVNGISPITASSAWFVGTVGCIISLASGSFLGRAVRVISQKPRTE